LGPLYIQIWGGGGVSAQGREFSSGSYFF